jgi:hypothetical protein
VVKGCRVRGEQAVNERVHLGGSGGVEPRQREGHRGGTPEQRIPSTVGMPSRQRAHTLSDYLSLHCSCETEWTVPLGVSSNIALYAPHARIRGTRTCAQLHSHAASLRRHSCSMLMHRRYTPRPSLRTSTPGLARVRPSHSVSHSADTRHRAPCGTHFSAKDPINSAFLENVLLDHMQQASAQTGIDRCAAVAPYRYRLVAPQPAHEHLRSHPASLRRVSPSGCTPCTGLWLARNAAVVPHHSRRKIRSKSWERRGHHR